MVVVGRVRTVHARRNFGFIDGGGPDSDVFFHKNSLIGAVLDELKHGDPVRFEIESADGRLRARNVRKITEDEYLAEEAMR